MMKLGRDFGGSMLRVAIGLFFSLGFCSPVFADDPSSLALDPIKAEQQLLGQPLTVTSQGNVLPSGQGVSDTTRTDFLGTNAELVQASVEAIPQAAAATPDATPAPGVIPLGRTDLYIGGTRVWAGQLSFQKGSLVYSGGVAPTQIPYPIFAYPLGPVMLEVDAGIEFEGDLNASLTPGLSYPLSDSSLGAAVQANLMASGFIEGYASLWIVRAGVEGALTLVRGSTGISSHLFFDGRKPQSAYIGSVTLLNGSVFGFVDTNLLFGKWTRVIRKNFFSFPGYCFAFQGSVCGI